MDNKNEFAEKLYRDYSQKVFYYIRSKINNYDDAEDLLSDIFTKACAHLDSFDESKASVSTWLYTIARNTVIDYLKLRRESLELDENQVSDEESPEERSINSEMLESLAGALEKIDPVQKKLVIQRYYYNRTLKDISEMLNISYGKCKRLHNAALLSLRMGMQL